MPSRRRLLLPTLLLSALPTPAQTPTYTYRVLHRYPHSTSSYTEGLFFQENLLYEGTGLEAHSGILIYPLGATAPTRHVDLPPQYFGEGIIPNGHTLLQWTWRSHTGFVFDAQTLKPLRQFHYTGEGWGITRNPHELITSDGTSTLRFRNPETFAETHTVTVHDGPSPIDQINELEWIHGLIFANIWHTDRIAEISPSDGHVVAWIDLTGLLPDTERLTPESVLNGIAFDPIHNRIFVTGKQWPNLFEIQIFDPAHPPHPSPLTPTSHPASNLP